MDKKQENTDNVVTLTNIPEVIDPGITIPIYEEDFETANVIGTQQTQKLGSYRARAGKFSNTLSNLLPSISAKLHHSKKSSSGKATAEDASVNSSESSVVGRNGTSPLKATKQEVTSMHGTPFDTVGHVTPPQELEKLTQFPDTNNFMLNPPRSSNDSYTFNTSGTHQFSRSRNNTTSSQLTNMSSLAQQNPTTSSVLWSNTNHIIPTNDPLPQHILQQINTNGTAANSLNDYTKNTYYESLVATSSNSMAQVQQPISNINSNTIPGTNVINNLTVPNNNVWSNTLNVPNNINRQRSLSNASSIYTDAPLYEQPSRSRATSNFTLPQQTGHDHPQVCDEIDPRSINWVSADPSVPAINQIANLLPTNTISISNVYPLQQQQPSLTNAINLTSTSLATLCCKFGEVVSARTLRGINMALVEFDSVDSAVRALENLQGKEVSMIGAPSNVCFAKILPMHQQQYNAPSITMSEPSGPQPLLQEQLYSGAVTFHQQGNFSIPVFNQSGQHQEQHATQHQPQNTNTNHNYSYSSHTYNNDKEQCPFLLPPPGIKETKDELSNIIESFETPYDKKNTQSLINKSSNFKGTSDTTNFGPLPEPLSNRDFDAPRLRELRKSIDNNSLSSIELEQLAMCMLEELPDLSSDYLGNTIVQKLFECSSDIIKDIMLRKNAKYLASMGVHKNGTWACQKMITKAKTPRQIMLVTEGIKDYCTPLFNDQFGNYVIQCVLKFGSPWNNFIFESIAANFWTIVQNRYGARAVRACLEAHDIIAKEQILILSGMIVLFAEYLATNSNGTLLLTWFLDTCVLPKRHSILVPRLNQNIVELCRHRLASLTILKILNFRGDEGARKATLCAIFGDPDSDEPAKALQQILSDTTYGPTFIFKVLTMPLLEDDVRVHVVNQVRKAIKDIPTAQQHRRLMEEIGLAPAAPTQAGQGKHRKSGSHAGTSESVSHMRGLSMSSVRSSGSRQANVMGNPQQSNVHAQPSGNTGSVGYYNYPGLFPGGYSNNNSNTNNHGTATNINSNANPNQTYMGNSDDITNQLDMFHLSNGTHISLPQLSLSNNDSSLNRLKKTKSNNANGEINTGYGGFSNS